MNKQKNKSGLTEKICIVVIGTALTIGVFSDYLKCGIQPTKQSFQRGSGDIPNNKLNVSGSLVGVKTADIYTKQTRSYDGE